jgi:hypothetical protein
MPFIGKTPTRVPLTSADIQDSTINSAKITDDAIVNADVNSSAAIAYSKLNLTGNIALADLSATGTQDATTFLRGDNTFAEAGGGITEADQWRLTTTTNQATDADITTNWERVDSTGWDKIGTGMTESSGIFTFPSTGIYLITFSASFNITNNNGGMGVYFNTTVDNSTYNTVAQLQLGQSGTSSCTGSATQSTIFDVTSTSTHKIKFTTYSMGTSTYIYGDTNSTYSGVAFIRLGDT